MKIPKLRSQGHQNNVPINEIATHYLATIVRLNLTTLYFHQVGKSTRSASAKFRLAVLEQLTRNDAYAQAHMSDKLKVAHRAACKAGYTIVEVDPNDYIRKNYLADVKQEALNF